jgi:hypothetical protein
MSTNVALLMVQCQIALGLTQKAMGELLGKDRRTIQRWQDRGCTLMPDDAETLAKALRPEHPDLADAVLALGHETAKILGMAPAVTPEVIEEILQTAAEAGGVSADTLRAALTAAFVKVVQDGFDIRAVVAGMMARPG